MSRYFVLLPIMIALVAVPMVRAAEQTNQKPEASQDSTAEEIHKTVASLEKHFNAGDLKDLAACWMPDGEFVGPRGGRIDGREKIEAAFGDFLATHPTSKLRLNVISWRQVADDVALVDLIAEMTPVPEGLEAEPSSTMVLVKRDGRWLIGSMHESVSTAPSHHIRLKSLAWIVGDWVEEGADKAEVSVRSSCGWTANSSYLIRKFSAEGRNGAILAGTEVIGWDPRGHRIRSWVFDFDGGFGESTWTRDGNRWIIEHTGILADGGDVRVTHIVTPIDADTITVQSKGRTINGDRQPDDPAIKLKRLPAQNAAAPKPSEPPKRPEQVLPGVTP